MKKQFLMFAALLIVSLAALAQGQKRFNLYAVGFYNQACQGMERHEVHQQVAQHGSCPCRHGYG